MSWSFFLGIITGFCLTYLIGVLAMTREKRLMKAPKCKDCKWRDEGGTYCTVPHLTTGMPSNVPLYKARSVGSRCGSDGDRFEKREETPTTVRPTTQDYEELRDRAEGLAETVLTLPMGDPRVPAQAKRFLKYLNGEAKL